MKLLSQFWGRFAVTMAMVASLFASAAAVAQDKPVLLVAGNSLDSMLADFKYLATTAGVPEVSGLAGVMIKGFTEGLDRAKPWGVVVSTDGIEFKAYGFVAVKNLKQVLETVEQQTGREIGDAGNGVSKIDGPNGSIFIKEINGWAYLSSSPDHLKGVVADPSKLVAPLIAKYDLAVEINVKNVPAQYIDIFLAQMKQANARALEQGLEDQDDAQVEFSRELNKRMMGQIETAIEEVQTITYALSVDAANKATFLEVGVSFKDGGKYAGQLQALGQLRTNYAGFLLPGAAANLHFASKSSKEDVELTLSMLKRGRTQVLAQVEKDPKLPNDEARDAAKEVVNGLMDVVAKTVESGMMDGGAVLSLDPKVVAFAGGGHVVDGPSVEKILRRVNELAQNEPGFPGVKFNAGKHGGMSFHTIEIPVPEHEKARQFIGPTMQIVLATGDKTVYVAAGKDPQALLKQVIDASAADANKATTPAELSISLAPILRFAADAEPNNPGLRAILPQLENLKNDKIFIRTNVDGSMVSYRIAVEEGVLKAIGLAAKAAQGGARRPPVGDGF